MCVSVAGGDSTAEREHELSLQHRATAADQAASREPRAGPGERAGPCRAVLYDVCSAAGGGEFEFHSLTYGCAFSRARPLWRPSRSSSMLHFTLLSSNTSTRCE